MGCKYSDGEYVAQNARNTKVPTFAGIRSRETAGAEGLRPDRRAEGSVVLRNILNLPEPPRQAIQTTTAPAGPLLLLDHFS